MQPVAGQREDRGAVGLDEVGLVDPLLLDIRGRVIDARPASWRFELRGSGKLGREGRETPRSHETKRMLPRVAHKLVTGAVALEPEPVRGARVASGFARARAGGDSCEDRESRRRKYRSTRASHPS